MNRDQDHPSAERLVAYAEGELGPESAPDLHEHLKTCAECRNLVRDLADYPDLESPGAAYEVDDDELRATLGELRARQLEASTAAPAEDAPAPVSPFEKTTAPSRSGWWPLMTAAVLVLVLGWGVLRDREARRLTERVSKLEESHIRPVVLVPIDDPMRSPQALDISLGAGILLVLMPDDLPVVVNAEIHIPDGETVLRFENREPWADGGISFLLLPGKIAPGVYRIRLTGPDGSKLASSFELRLTE